MIRAAAAAAGLAALGIARLLPEEGAGLYLRLAAATIVVLLPGLLVARAFRCPGPSAALAWTLGVLFCALALTFAVHSSLWLTLGLFAAAGLAALVLPRRRKLVAQSHKVGGAWWWIVLAGGVVLGMLLWHVAGEVSGDGPFHLARVRKLEEFGSLSLRAVDEFRDGGLHPGYAFPLWHGFLALVARLAGVDPALVVRHESSVLAPLALLVTYEAGAILFRSRALGVAAVTAFVGLFALAPGHGGAFRTLALPATAAQILLVPTTLALAFRASAQPAVGAYATLVSAGLALAFVHPTYAIFVLIPLGGYLLVRAALEWRDAPALGGAVGAIAAPTLAVGLWLLPLVNETVSHEPTSEVLFGTRHGIARYAGQIDVWSTSSYRLAPEVIDRRGALAIAALALLPFAGLAARRRWSSYVLGGSLAVFAVVLTPFLFPRLADAVSLSQARRSAAFIPLAFALAGGLAVLARPLGLAVLPLALGAGIGLQLAYPGDFGYEFGGGGPAAVTWFGAIGAAAAFVGAAISRRGLRIEGPGLLAALAAGLLVLPVAVSGFRHWEAPVPVATQDLTPGLVQALRQDVPKGDVVFSDPETSYLIAAQAPVYVAVAPPTHVADTKANHPDARARDAARFFRTANLAIPRRYGAGWLVVDRVRSKLAPPLERVYSDRRYVMYRL